MAGKRSCQTEDRGAPPHSFLATVRSIDEKTRTAIFVAATETGVESPLGAEYLLIPGGIFDRYRANPVIVDSHDIYSSVTKTIGRGDIAIENRELVVSSRFGKTRLAEEVWSLVVDDIVRAVSVRFAPKAITIVAEGESYRLGERDIAGPARIITSWELWEISVVSVPADPNALRRCAECPNGCGCTITSPADTKEQTMPDEKTKDTAAPAPAAKTEERSAPPVREELPAEIAARNELARATTIRAICPHGLEACAERCIVEGATVADARKRMLDELTVAAKPVGTTEPMPITRGDKMTTEAADAAKVLTDMPSETFLRALGG